MPAICDLGHPMTSNLYQRDHTVQELLSRYSRPPGRSLNSRESHRSCAHKQILEFYWLFRELARHVARSAVPLGARALGISRELPGAFDVGSADAARALAFNGAAADALAEQLELARQGGGSKAVARHVKKNGKVLVRDRIRSLVDEGAPFLEFSQLAGLGLYGHAVPAAGLVTGIGVIRRRARHRHSPPRTKNRITNS